MGRLPVTFSLITACVLVYAGVVALGVSPSYPWNEALVFPPPDVLFQGALIPSDVAQGKLWTLISSMFLHSGFIHLGVNMLSLYFLGSFAEAAFGRGRFLALYLISGIAGGLAYLYFGSFTGPVVGASGAIFGLLGGVFGYTLNRGTFSWQNPVIRQLLILTALNIWLGLSVPNISNTAHIGGLLGGLAFGYLMAPTLHSRKRIPSIAPVAIAFGAEVVLLGVWLLFFVRAG